MSINRPCLRILGIDPGLRHTGWGIIDVTGNTLLFVATGRITPIATQDLPNRLLAIHNALDQVIGKWRPDQAAVEETFVNKDARATLKLGQARGIALLAPAKAGLMVSEYAPNQVKKSVIGVGHGDKNQIMSMINVLLPKAKVPNYDAADALAVAICHAHHFPSVRQQIALTGRQ